MKTEELGSIRYGNIRMSFEASSSVSDYLQEKSISFDSMFPKTQFFYQGVLMKIGISHEEEKELRIVFHGIRLDGEGVSDSAKSDSYLFDNFPIHVGDKIYLADFFVEVKNG